MTNENIRYEVIIQEGDGDDVLLPIPQELLDKMGWKEGDTLDFNLDEQGQWIIQKI
ncbi:AbrB/MazE/SpoVT family DNA-binding domain-containing protein [bacterium]|nr:AbrB/MazE/SpoVT family DNA-binding domain-containing protein [bacterium]